MKKMVILLAAILFLNATAIAEDFMHPMDFKGTQEEKNKVIQLIKQRVNKDFCQSELKMCQATTLRMMEKQNLDAFKKASQAQNREIMDRVIKDYCTSGLDMCSYSNLWMMYEQNLEASKESLAW